MTCQIFQVIQIIKLYTLFFQWYHQVIGIANNKIYKLIIQLIKFYLLRSIIPVTYHFLRNPMCKLHDSDHIYLKLLLTKNYKNLI